jgi:hypothetical protein
MKLTYFGLKNPKKVVLEVKGNKKEFVFTPFGQTEVPDDYGALLLRNAGDVFKRIDKDERAPNPKPNPKGEGYVGELAADQLPSVKDQIEEDTKAEEGVTVEQIIDNTKTKNNKNHSKTNKRG